MGSQTSARLSRRAILARAGGLALGGALATPIAFPAAAAARPGACGDSVKDILDILVTAEAIETTLYFFGIRSDDVFEKIEEEEQPYVQAALSSEQHHRDLLVSLGGTIPQDTFFFPRNSLDSVKSFFDVLLALEHGGLRAYGAATGRFGELGRPDLAITAARILGVEAEHRVLSRDIIGKELPNNLCLEPDVFECVSDVKPALQPFLDGSQGHTLKKTMPSDREIAKAVGKFKCK
jgi:hypothetical protein